MESPTIMEEEEVQQETVAPTTPGAYPPSHYGGFPGPAFPIALAPVVLPVAGGGERSSKPIRPTPILPVPPSSKMATLNLKEKERASPPPPPPPPLPPLIEPLPLSLKLPSPPPKDQSPATSSHSSPSSSSSASSFQVMPAGNFNGGGDSIISVA